MKTSCSLLQKCCCLLLGCSHYRKKLPFFVNWALIPQASLFLLVCFPRCSNCLSLRVSSERAREWKNKQSTEFCTVWERTEEPKQSPWWPQCLRTPPSNTPPCVGRKLWKSCHWEGSHSLLAANPNQGTLSRGGSWCFGIPPSNSVPFVVGRGFGSDVIH
jgi:hypothetical protein